MIALDCLKEVKLTENPKLSKLEEIEKKMAINSYLGASLCYHDVFSVSSERLSCILYIYIRFCFYILCKCILFLSLLIYSVPSAHFLCPCFAFPRS